LYVVERLRQASNMHSRTDGMWWGTAIEAPDPGALANFYSELLGWPIGHAEPGTVILAPPRGSIYIVFQQATDYRAPVWPPEAQYARLLAGALDLNRIPRPLDRVLAHV